MRIRRLEARPGRRLRALLGGAGALVLVALTIMIAPGAGAAPSHAQIEGTGSSWAANAVDQWDSDVTAQGLKVVYTDPGSAPGRKDFANGITDFAVSDIGYQGTDPLTGAIDTPCGIQSGTCRKYAYEPVVAGGTSFPYQIKVAGKPVTNLRLSGQTLAKIFTFNINNWDDPAVTADNNGRKLPSLPIIRVVHSEGSGSTAQFTAFLAKQYPSLWSRFAGGADFTEYFPVGRMPSGKGLAQNGSDGVMNTVSSKAGNGAIGYDEYSYPLGSGWPVAKIENKAGYFTLPDQYNVAVALRHAVINMNPKSPDYLLQNLDQVYVAPEVQAYPLSSYSYFIIPTAANDARMTTAKRQTLADYLFYAVCQGQSEMGKVGYSPLPINLVQASFAQTALLKTADSKVDLTKRDVASCHNPTFTAGNPNDNHLADIAPRPAACDKSGAGPCADNVGHTSNPGANGAVPGANPDGGSSTGGTHASGAAGGSASKGPTAGTGSPSASKSIDPVTGQQVDAVSDQSDNGDVVGEPTELAAYRQPDLTGVLVPVAVAALLAVLLLPPAFYLYLLRRRGRS